MIIFIFIWVGFIASVVEHGFGLPAYVMVIGLLALMYELYRVKP